MVDVSVVSGFIAMILLFLVPPGPDMAYMLGVGLQGGPRAALKAILGIATGMTIYAAAVVAGVGQIATSYPAALNAVKLIGAAYLLWLAFGTFKDARKAFGHASDIEAKNWYLRGLLVALTNPKIMLFFLAVLPQFLGSATNPNLQLAMLGAINVTTELVLYGTLGLCAGSLNSRFRANGKAQMWINYLAGTVYVGLAVFIIVDILVN